MDKKKRRLVVTISPGLLDRLDAVCRAIHRPKPNRSAAVEEAIERWVKQQERKLER